ncbi:hypothetical protein [Agathobaculum sp.]|uniref:hypothetical protein n=1 Tax=Agathobaculum sp. TaxID=2048138 RepID=UPI002A7FEF9D|nr:hypothetical protein [Agathobaculum sp.]MDY3618090.1 hypothetical protein [Agathobaculum sp.]
MFKGLASFCQFLLDAIAAVLAVICNLFPPSPFKIISNAGFSDLLAQINYFLPVYEFLTIAEAWLICIIVYYAISVVARWLKAIE